MPRERKKDSPLPEELGARPNVWLFQANPLRKEEAFTQADFRAQFARSSIQTWGCRQHWREVREGDYAIVFFTGRHRHGGIYGVGEIVEAPLGPRDDVCFALFPKTTRRLIRQPITYEELDPLNLPNFRMCHVTVYRINYEQWTGILNLIEARQEGLTDELV